MVPPAVVELLSEVGEAAAPFAVVVEDFDLNLGDDSAHRIILEPRGDPTDRRGRMTEGGREISCERA